MEKRLQDKEQIKEFIAQAFETAKKLIMGKDENGHDQTYYDLMLKQRIEGPTNAGSSYDVSSSSFGTSAPHLLQKTLPSLI